MNNNVTSVEFACRRLAGNDETITFTTIAEHTGISRRSALGNISPAEFERRHHNTTTAAGTVRRLV